MQEHYSAFAIVAFTVKLSAAGNTLDGGADATPGIPAGHTDAPALNMRAVLSPNVPNTALGIEAYNIARRPSRSIFRRLRSPSSASTTSSASSSSGGSSAFGMATGTSATIFGGSNQAGTSNEGSDVEDAVARRPDLGSRSSTTGSGTGRALPTRETLAEAQERLRRIAGAGTPSGLGTGLLRCVRLGRLSGPWMILSFRSERTAHHRDTTVASLLILKATPGARRRHYTVDARRSRNCPIISRRRVV